MHRRQFLKGFGLCAAAVAARARVASPELPNGPTQIELPRLANLPVSVRSGLVVSASEVLPKGFKASSNREPISATRVKERLGAALSKLLPGGLSALVGPKDVVAIKVNALAAPHLAPRPELLLALAELLTTCGVKPGNIIIWDRTTREIVSCGLRKQTDASDIRVYGTDALRGGGYGNSIESFGSVGSLVSLVLSRYATVLISVGVLKDHDLAGVSGAMKNLFGAIHNPNRYHDYGCDPFVAEVFGLPSIRRRYSLSIIDATLGQAEGGPAYASQWVWPEGRILVGVDPVAVDTVCRDLIGKRRSHLGLPSLAEASREPKWLATGERLGLGLTGNVKMLEA